MSNLPPLRTVRDSLPDGFPAPRAAGGVPKPPFPATAFVAAARKVPPPAAKVVAELQSQGLLDADALDALCEHAGDRTHQLSSSDRVLDALVQYGMLTGYQRTRISGGNVFGLVFDNYRILERIGGGTIGVVFLAEHLLLKRKVAIKVLPEDETTPPQAVARFKIEAELLARVQHPHVIGVYDAGVLPSPGAGRPTMHYLVMELVTGKDLEQTVYDLGELAVPLAAGLFRQAALGLAACHANNLTHRDVKPSNVLVTDTRRVKFIDFGLARHFGSTRTPRPCVLGSVEFMAPEQTIDPATAGPPSDVYGLGAMLFWALTGELPFPRATKLREAFEAIRKSPPYRLKQFRTGLPEALEALVAKTLRKNPAERPSAWEVAQALEKFADPSIHPGYDSAKDAPPVGTPEALRFAVQHLEDVAQAAKQNAEQSGAAIVKTLAQIAAARGETVHQQVRVQEYVRILISRLSAQPGWQHFQDAQLVEEVVRAAAARNVGTVAVPDILLHREAVSPGERQAFEAHTTAGSDLLQAVAGEFGAAMPFLRTVRAVVRHHHEKWDGTGYPDRLSREAIPHAARLVALADAYDALRKDENGLPGLTHLQAVSALTREWVASFDPLVLDAFRAANLEFEDVFAEAQERKLPPVDARRR